VLVAKAKILGNHKRSAEAIVGLDSALASIEVAAAGNAALRTRQGVTRHEHLKMVAEADPNTWCGSASNRSLVA
jgi:hypothetical protein